MKGIALQSLMIIILFLLLLSGLLIFLLYRSADLSAGQRAALNAEQIAGIINVLQASPAVTTHVMDIDDKCTVTIDSSSVTLRMERKDASGTAVPLGTKTFKAGIIQTGITVKPATLDCERKNRLFFTRCATYVEVSDEKISRCE